jgi:hypothetical protein
VQHQRKREESAMHALDCATSGFLILWDSSSRMRCLETISLGFNVQHFGYFMLWDSSSRMRCLETISLGFNVQHFGYFMLWDSSSRKKSLEPI